MIHLGENTTIKEIRELGLGLTFYNKNFGFAIPLEEVFKEVSKENMLIGINKAFKDIIDRVELSNKDDEKKLLDGNLAIINLKDVEAVKYYTKVIETSQEIEDTAFSVEGIPFLLVFNFIDLNTSADNIVKYFKSALSYQDSLGLPITEL